jgi:hypothetical protein
MQERAASSAVRKIVLMLLVLAVVAFAMTANVQRVEAVGNLYVCTYYSDAAHTTVVGARGGGCCGRTTNWGVTSPYSVCYPLACTDVICPD